MKKRILSILLLCCMVLTLLPTAAFAAGELPDVKLSVPTKIDVIVDLTEQNKEVKIKDSKTYLIKGSTDPNWYFQYRIKIDGKNNTPHIFLDGVRLQAPKDGPAIELYGGASACLYFIGGDSELIGAENFAALQKNKTEGYLRVLVQTGTKLTCQGGHHAAGIGGSKVGIKKFSQGYGVNLHFGSLATDIYGGEIFATSGVGGAGIGGGANGGVGEQIYVYSGKLTAISVSQGAGIGGGQGGPGRHIYIRGGTVEAGSRSAGAGIGSGDYAGPGASEDTHDIEISGGRVLAWSNYAGAGIGGGRYSSGHDISIIGGEVEAQGYWGAGIGGGMNGDSGNILIQNATLKARSVPLYPDKNYESSDILPAVAVGRGSNRTVWMAVLRNQEYLMGIEENVKIGASNGKSVRLRATGWQWRLSQGPYEVGWGTTTELLIPNEHGRVDLQRLSLPYACNYGRVIGELELHCEERACGHEFAWTDRDGCHIWACVKCGARDPAAENSKQNAKHIPGDWGVQEMRCAVCDHLLEKDTNAPVLEVLKDGESYTIEDNIDGNPGAYSFTVSDPAASGETSSGIKSVTINGEPQDGPTYRLPAPDGGNNDAGAEYTVVATDNAGNETKATVRTYRRHHMVEGDPQYKVTVQGSANGSVTVVNATKTAEDGTPLFFKDEFVVLSIAPDEGYMLSTLSVNGTPATVAVGEDTYTFAQPEGDVTITAAFEKRNDHTVTFDAGGGSEPEDLPEEVTTAMPAKKILHGSAYYLPECEFIAPEGKQFKAWEIDGTEYPVNAPVIVTADITVKALWENARYTITFDTAGGSEIAPITQDYGTAISSPADPTREGYIFMGWDKEIPKTMPAENITVTAQWKDSEKPTGEIKINENSWKAFLNNITFGLFFKDTQTVTITAADNSGETVAVEYLLSAKELTKAELDGMAFTAYTAPFGIDPDNEYIIYVRLTDKAGNTDYICSDGIVLDGISPVITGIEDGKTYCEAQTVTIDEKYVDTVTVNGTAVTLDENNSFVLSPADGEQRIIVTDKAGNTAEMTVTVNDGHTGGTATCTEKAVCEVCGKAYGELDPNNHTDLKHFPAKAATEDAEGNIEYWYCEGCNKYYSDKDGTKEIKKADTVTAKLPKSPPTGDNSNLMPWFALLFVSGGAVICTAANKRKKQQK